MLMLRRLRQLVLILLSATLALLPYTEHACNWDRFPTASNDLELQVVGCLCAIGMFLVFARQFRLKPQAFRVAFIFGSVLPSLTGSYDMQTSVALFPAEAPLRI